MEKRLKEQDEKLIIGTNKIIELSQEVDSLKARLGNRDIRAAGPSTPPTEDSSEEAPLAPITPHTAAQTSTPPSLENNASRPEADFVTVRRGAKPTRPVIQPTKCSNRFQILEEDDEPECSYLVGDSIIRQQLTEFCGRVKAKRRLFCLPGAGVDDVTDVLDQVAGEATAESLFVIHTGTNDVQKTRSEELLDKYRRLIQQYKTKSSNIIISGVLPRISADNVFYSKAFSLNNRLQSLCREHGVEFVNMWNDFYNKAGLFLNDGLHLSAVGAARFGRLISEAVRSYWAKNGTGTDATETTR